MQAFDTERLDEECFRVALELRPRQSDHELVYTVQWVREVILGTRRFDKYPPDVKRLFDLVRRPKMVRA